NKKFAELKLTIDLQKSTEPENIKKAMEIVKKNTGKQYMDDIRLEIISFENEEKILLEKRKGDFRENRAQITTIIGIEIAFFTLMGAITAFFIQNKLFLPIEMLLTATSKMEKGQKQTIEDILPNDEMGYLLSRFYKMSEKIFAKTKTLAYEATHDSLTGLKNRSSIYEEIAESIGNLAGTDIKMAVFFIDLNKFKQLNDTLGHDAGDAILKETANRLDKFIPLNSSIFRVGGDEFVLIIRNITQKSHVKSIVSKLLKVFIPPFILLENSIDISLSIGIAISPDDSTNTQEILKFADIAMYTTKRDKECASYRFFDKAMLKRKSVNHSVSIKLMTLMRIKKTLRKECLMVLSSEGL
ncbi:MAG: diguanylate cyclase, partial [Alcanivoracaceae bacterium]|nr:diguanylate cyclase [Alcanivoracaceae bacterium]